MAKTVRKLKPTQLLIAVIAIAIVAGVVYAVAQGQVGGKAREDKSSTPPTPATQAVSPTITVNGGNSSNHTTVAPTVNVAPTVVTPPAPTQPPAPKERTEQLDSRVETKKTNYKGERDSNDSSEQSFIAPAGWYIEKSKTEVKYHVQTGSEAECRVNYGRQVTTADGRSVPTEIKVQTHARSEGGFGASAGRCHAVVTFKLYELPK